MANPELVRHRPHPCLAGLVAGFVGSHERADDPVERRQPAGSLLPLVVSFGDPLDVISLSEGEGTGRYSSFIAGFMPGHATTRFVGTQRCVQVYLTPLGAYRLLGLPGRELARRVVGVDEVAPFLGGSLPERLAETTTWAGRIGVVEQTLLSALDAGPEPEPFVAWLWSRIRDSGGRARIDDLVAQTGWSHRHVTTRFRVQIGLSPKAAGGIVRFEPRGPCMPWGVVPPVSRLLRCCRRSWNGASGIPALGRRPVRHDDDVVYPAWRRPVPAVRDVEDVAAGDCHPDLVPVGPDMVVGRLRHLQYAAVVQRHIPTDQPLEQRTGVVVLSRNETIH
ncbi:hypothetical protein LKO27_10285 [Tessaracoccus sp. OS52]|nr:hypothetical protein [Tessaracoccus sp. OS52]MCC2593792.1 hypothetical protein [Tessaracoccus sp. OS52]